MASVIAVGHGSTLGFSTFAASIRSIGGFTQDREAVDASHLGLTTLARKVPSGLVEPGSFECEFIFDPNASTTSGTTASDDFRVGHGIPDPTGSVSTCTITFPAGANTAGADVVGRAFCTSWTSPELTSDGLMTGTMTLQFEGETGTSPTNLITWSAATT